MNEFLPVCGDISVVNQPPNTSLYSLDGFMSESTMWPTINQPLSTLFTSLLVNMLSKPLILNIWAAWSFGLTEFLLRTDWERQRQLHWVAQIYCLKSLLSEHPHLSERITCSFHFSLLRYLAVDPTHDLKAQHLDQNGFYKKGRQKEEEKKKSSHETQNWFHLTVSNRLRQWGSSLPAHCCYAAWSLTHIACSLLFKQPTVLDGKAMLVTEVTALCLWHTALSIWVAQRDPRYLRECFYICMWEMGVFVCIAMRHTVHLSWLEMCKRKCKRKTCLRGECFEEIENLMV